MCLGSALLLFMTIRGISKCEEARKWLTAPGQIMYRSIDGSLVDPRKQATDFIPEIHQVCYAYQVEGQEYIGDKVSPLSRVVPGLSLDDIDEFGQNAQQATFRVHYNPEFPEEAYLKTDLNPFILVALFLASSFLFLLGGLLMVAIRET